MEEFAKQHPLFALLQISQYNGQLSPGSTVGIAHAKDMDKISEYLNMKQVKEVLPRNLALNGVLRRSMIRSSSMNYMH